MDWKLVQKLVAEYKKGVPVQTLAKQNGLSVDQLNQEIAKALVENKEYDNLPNSITLKMGDEEILAAKAKTIALARGKSVEVYVSKEGKPYYRYLDANGKETKVSVHYSEGRAWCENVSEGVDKIFSGEILDGVSQVFSSPESASVEKQASTGVVETPSIKNGSVSLLKNAKNIGKWAKTAATAVKNFFTGGTKAAAVTSNAVKTGKQVVNAGQKTVNLGGKTYKLAERVPRKKPTMGLESQKPASTKAQAQPKPATPKAEARPPQAVTKQNSPKVENKPQAPKQTPNNNPTVEQKTAVRQAETAPQAKSAKAVEEVKPRTYDEVSAEMDNLSAKMKAKRNEVNQPFESKLSKLEEQQAKLETEWAEHNAAYIEKTNVQAEAIERLNSSLSKEKAALTALEQQTQNAEQSVIEYRSALGELEKQFGRFQETNGTHGGQVEELWNYTQAQPKQFIGAEFKNNVNIKTTPDNASSHFYNDKIAEIFHEYNITSAKNKTKVVQSLREACAEAESKFQSLSSKIGLQQQKVNGIQSELEAAHTSRNALEASNDAFAQNYHAQSTTLNSQISATKTEQQSAIDALMNSGEYSTIHKTWKALQAELRSLAQ